MSNMQDMSEGGTGLGDEAADALLGGKSLSYAQPTLVDRVKTFFAKKQPSQGHPGNSGTEK